ncbi:MAG: hypothetical protein WC670_19240 [Pseudolabrys sp.]|jgi:hypothetical protein
MAERHTFDVKITRSVARNNLRWPERGEALDESGLGCNRAYMDLRFCTWRDAKRVFDQESVLIERLEAAADLDEEYELIVEELYEEDEGLFGLDIGVASSAIALSAAGCVSCSSCNAGAYGGSHYELYPVVAFFAKAQQVDLLLQFAEEANIGLENGGSGIVVAYAGDVRNMRAFADALIRKKTDFRVAARRKRAEVGAEPIEAQPSAAVSGQLKLPLD